MFFGARPFNSRGWRMPLLLNNDRPAVGAPALFFVLGAAVEQTFLGGLACAAESGRCGCWPQRLNSA
jgi:hypothetical protein